MRTALATAGGMAAAVAVALVVSVVSLIVIAPVQWPAFNSSNQLHALTTVGQCCCLAGLLGTGWLWRRGRRVLAYAAALVFLAAFSVVTLAMPLGATKLYLFGISVDQQFRTEYLTRLADSAALHDMTYVGLPPYYPPGWFWIGGRAAALTGTPAWEMFKPWAITSIAIAVVLAFVLWQRLIRFDYALIVTAATAATTLAYASTEPYAAMITVLLPPVLVLAWWGMRAAGRSGWAAVVGVGVFLGVAALWYTLLLAYGAFTVTVMALIAAAARRKHQPWRPLLRLAVAGAVAGAIALIGWLPYLLAVVGSSPAGSDAAQHYLPADGAQLSFPMLRFTALGALCMVGTIWLVVRATSAEGPGSRSRGMAAALAIGVLTIYAWSLLSMLTTLAGTTLLSYRLQPTLTVLLSAAGAFGFVEGALWLARQSTSAASHQSTTAASRRVVVVAGVLGFIGAVTFSQDIPNVLRPDLVVAYTDTDGNGQRADRRPPGAETYYRRIDDEIRRLTGRPRDQTVVLTADYSFLSYYPYWGFQGLTPHYANPLAQFDRRAAAIRSWSALTSPGRFLAALDSLPWQPPTVFLMRWGANGTYTLRLATDVYPNQPNVRRYQVPLDARLFQDPRFTVSNIGPFVLAVRRPGKAA
jgi:galactan 5-O-arabinofuranosyltransferase